MHEPLTPHTVPNRRPCKESSIARFVTVATERVFLGVIRRVNPLHSPLVEDMVQTSHGNALAILVRIPRAARVRGGAADITLMDRSPE